MRINEQTGSCSDALPCRCRRPPSTACTANAANPSQTVDQAGRPSSFEADRGNGTCRTFPTRILSVPMFGASDGTPAAATLTHLSLGLRQQDYDAPLGRRSATPGARRASVDRDGMPRHVRAGSTFIVGERPRPNTVKTRRNRLTGCLRHLTVPTASGLRPGVIHPPWQRAQPRSPGGVNIRLQTGQTTAFAWTADPGQPAPGARDGP